MASLVQLQLLFSSFLDPNAEFEGFRSARECIDIIVGRRMAGAKKFIELKLVWLICI
jgi:hypothetical protein